MPETGILKSRIIHKNYVRVFCIRVFIMTIINIDEENGVCEWVSNVRGRRCTWNGWCWLSCGQEKSEVAPPPPRRTGCTLCAQKISRPPPKRHTLQLYSDPIDPTTACLLTKSFQVHILVCVAPLRKRLTVQ